MKRLKKLSAVFLSLFATLATDGEARAASPRDLCAAANLVSLMYRDRDQCAENELQPSIAALLTQVADLNVKAASALGLKKRTPPLPFEFSLEIHESTQGPLASEVDGLVMRMMIFPGTEPRAVNSGLYLHEMGHITANAKSKGISRFLQRVATHPLLTEALGDAISTRALGVVISPEQDLPPCLDRLRIVQSGQSYDLALGYFLPDFAARRMVQCCKSDLVQKTFASRPDLQTHWKTACDEKIAAWEGEFKEFDRRKLGASTVKMNLESPEGDVLDPHQLGLPLKAFLFGLADRTETDVGLLYHRLFRAKDTTTKPLTCSVVGQPKLTHVNGPRVSLDGLLRGLRAALGPEFRAHFDAEWKKAGLDKLALLESRIVDFDAQMASVEVLKKKAKAAKSPCKQLQISIGEAAPAKCSVVCK